MRLIRRSESGDVVHNCVNHNRWCACLDRQFSEDCIIHVPLSFREGEKRD